MVWITHVLGTKQSGQRKYRNADGKANMCKTTPSALRCLEEEVVEKTDYAEKKVEKTFLAMSQYRGEMSHWGLVFTVRNTPGCNWVLLISWGWPLKPSYLARRKQYYLSDAPMPSQRANSNVVEGDYVHLLKVDVALAYLAKSKKSTATTTNSK